MTAHSLITPITTDNVVPFNAPQDTYITLFMFSQALQEALQLPPDWFSVTLEPDEDAANGVRQDHILVTRIGGLPVGSFQIWREPRGRFSVFATGEADGYADDFERLGLFHTMSQAVQSIRNRVDATSAVWGQALRQLSC